ncbi:MAG: hypothetical protein Q8K26_03485, partial [Candidatus Gracilibacteria bacterium]|nr:hypothetical protein [Candidatus Gracilibacteria bacterium]
NYLNLTGFAEYIRPFIEEKTLKSTSTHAIKMALSRMERPTHLPVYNVRYTHNQINTISGIILMSLIRSPGSEEKIQSFLSLGRANLNRYLAVIQGSREIDLLYEEALSGDIESIMPENLQILKIHNLSICSIQLRDDDVYQKGLFYSVTKKLAFHGINILQVISTYHELGVVVQSADLKKAVTVLMG